MNRFERVPATGLLGPTGAGRASRILCALLLSTGSAFGQVPRLAQSTATAAEDAGAVTPARIQAGIGLLAGMPVGEFGTSFDETETVRQWRPWNWGDTIGGVSASIGVGLGSSVVSLGGEAAYLWYGNESRRVPLSYTIPDIVVTVSTDNAMFLLHGRVRAQVPSGRWRPYVDGLFGFTDIFTKTSIDETFECVGLYCRPGIQSTNLRDATLSMGGGGGVMVAFGSPPSKARLDLSLRYLRGGQADYLQTGAIRRESGQAFLDISHSRTDMFMIYIGVAIVP